MTAKEKAEELYFKYYLQVADGSFPEYNAKQCALIAVDEIINSVVIIDFTITESQFIYWGEVKQEIEKL